MNTSHTSFQSIQGRPRDLRNKDSGLARESCAIKNNSSLFAVTAAVDSAPAVSAAPVSFS